MYKLGIDIGSTTIKMALVEVSNDHVQSSSGIKILATDYQRHNAEPMKVGQEMIDGLLQRSGLTATLSNSPQDGLSIGITGSVGMVPHTPDGEPVTMNLRCDVSTATTRSHIKQVLSILSPSPKTSIVSFHN